MNGDLSRVTFNPLNHFTSIVLQQGRVQTDADGNEQAAILLHYMRSLAADLIGQHGGPGGSVSNPATRKGLISRNCGFGIVAARVQANSSAIDYFPSDDLLEGEKD